MGNKVRNKNRIVQLIKIEQLFKVFVIVMAVISQEIIIGFIRNNIPNLLNWSFVESNLFNIVLLVILYTIIYYFLHFVVTLIPNKNVFLGGPISNVMHNGVFDEKIGGAVKEVHKELKKTHKEVFSAHIAENFGENPPSKEEMFEKDKKWIDEAGSAIFILSYKGEKDNLPRTDGSYIEIGICYEREIPIKIISDADMNKLPTMLESMIRQSKKRNDDKIKLMTFDEFFKN